MKMTLLQMTQNILSAMTSDEVNSINDTVESQQVAEIIKETYYDLFSTIEVPEHTGIIQLEGVGDLTRPNYLRLPDNVVSIDWVKYRDTNMETYRNLHFLEPHDFLEKVLLNKLSHTDVELVEDPSGIFYFIKNNIQPTYYTIMNDQYLVTDSYDSTFDSTLQASKTFAWGETEDTWVNDDAFIPNLNNDLFPLLLSEAKSVCFVTLKQQANQKEEQRARRHRVHLQYRKWRDKGERAARFANGANYARTR